jgi:hypothetical protein
MENGPQFASLQLVTTVSAAIEGNAHKSKTGKHNLKFTVILGMFRSD